MVRDSGRVPYTPNAVPTDAGVRSHRQGEGPAPPETAAGTGTSGRSHRMLSDVVRTIVPSAQYPAGLS